MQRNWDGFWQPFLDCKKLNSKISELNTIDGSEETELICRNIYNTKICSRNRASPGSSPANQQSKDNRKSFGEGYQ